MHNAVYANEAINDIDQSSNIEALLAHAKDNGDIYFDFLIDSYITINSDRKGFTILLDTGALSSNCMSLELAKWLKDHGLADIRNEPL